MVDDSSSSSPPPRQPVLQDFVDETLFASPASSLTLLSDTAYDEQSPLLAKPRREKSKPWYRQAAPKLLVPFALASAICRGMTLAPRVQVFTQIACDELRIEPDRAYGPVSLRNSSGFVPSPIIALHMVPAPHVGTYNSAPSDACRVDPAVQQGAAKLQTVILTIAGTLSAVTSGFWGQFGDRHGRRVVIALSIFAMLVSDCIFLLAASQSANPAYSFLNASRLLVLSPLIEGFLGGFPTMQVAFNAYISDATAPGSSRAKLFARFFGIVSVGVAAGPTLSSLLPFNPFHSSIVLGASNLMLLLLFLPESLTNEHHMSSAQNSKPENQGWINRIRGYVTGTLRGTLEPMAILLPKKRTGQGQAVSGYDWNLTYLAAALSLYLLTIAINSVKFLYAQHSFGWGSEQLSYYISFIGSLRALNLIVVLPYLIKLYKPKAPVPSPTTSPSGSVTALNTPATFTRTTSLPAVPKLSPSPPGTKTPLGLSATNAQLIHRSILLSREQQFDLLVARMSMVMDFWSYFLLCSSTSATGFVLTTTLSAFGGGTSPAMQSLALGLGGEEKDVGKLFGALSMLSSISSTILSPMIFGSLYSLTVAAAPKAIFIVATGVLTASLVFLALVQPRQPLRRRDLEEFPDRGRSRRSKDLRRTYSG